VDSAERRRLHEDLTRLADGDREAFHPVFVCLWPLLRRFAARHLSGAEADDVAQEALVRVFLRAAEFDPSRDGLSWVLGIAAYEIKTARRRRQRRGEQPMNDVALPSDPGSDPEQRAVSRDLAAAMDAALQGLRPADAGSLRAYAEGLRPEGVAPATFRKRVQRGLARLREAWRGSHGDV
jgi:RNA polymerase sigma factor (sigma-70 family)